MEGRERKLKMDEPENVQIEKERDPRGGLMFRYRRDNGNVNFRVTGVPQRVKPGDKKR